MNPHRRRFLKLSSLAAGSTLLRGSKLAYAAIPGGTLPPADIPKYVAPMVIPPVMPRTTGAVQRFAKNADYYEIAARQFQQQILPTPLPRTTVWSYGSANHAGTFHYPSFTIEAKWNKPARVKWINDLKDASGNYLPHLLPIDPTLHWANPPGGVAGRDRRPDFLMTPGPYTGPVPLVTHVHGAHTTEDSDGYPEAWFLPAANNIPASYATEGTFYAEFKAKFEAAWGQPWEPGSAIFQYPNSQRATTLWYHDHTLGMTRSNVYAGPAGFYLLRGGPDEAVGGVLPGPAPKPGAGPGTKYYEIPIAIQDRSFNADGSLFYPDSREFFDGYGGPYVPYTDLSPIWNPEFFGNTMVVNGRTWPYLEVEQRRYRFRFLNGCNSRFLILKFSQAGLNFWQIGTEGGFLPAPVELERLLMGPAERADVIVDFSSLPVGAEVLLLNLGPDEPFGGGEPDDDFDVADPDTTGQVMMFRIVPPWGVDLSTPPDQLILPAVSALGPAASTRQVSLNEMMSMYFDGPAAAMLGTMHDGMPHHKMWSEPITEDPVAGQVELWELYNFTADAHPIHLHQVQFQVVDRQELAVEEEEVILPVELVGEPAPPEPWETGYKDTVIAYPGQVTRLKARFDIPGLFVWHCHIVEHEDNEMMRPLRVGP